MNLTCSTRRCGFPPLIIARPSGRGDPWGGASGRLSMDRVVDLRPPRDDECGEVAPRTLRSLMLPTHLNLAGAAGTGACELAG